MGDYSAICAVSGIPITNSQKVVGFELEPYRFGAEIHRFVPRSWPVIGKYDMSGGIEGQNLDCNCALIHFDIWENAEMYWHYMAGEVPQAVFDVCTITELLERAEKDKMYSRPTGENEYQWTKNDYLFHAFFKIESTTEPFLILRKLFDSKEGQGHNITNVPKDLCFLERNAFAECILDRIVKGWTKEDDKTLLKIICLYYGETITGRQIAPCQFPFVEQYPEYKQRIKILALHTKLIKKLNKELR